MSYLKVASVVPWPQDWVAPLVSTNIFIAISCMILFSIGGGGYGSSEPGRVSSSVSSMLTMVLTLPVAALAAAAAPNGIGDGSSEASLRKASGIKLLRTTLPVFDSAFLSRSLNSSRRYSDIYCLRKLRSTGTLISVPNDLRH